MEIHTGIVKTKQQMANEYGICIKTFDKLLKKKRIKLDRGLICPKDQVIIYNRLGNPNSIQKLLSVPKNSI
jgi:hypothetical protein